MKVTTVASLATSGSRGAEENSTHQFSNRKRRNVERGKLRKRRRRGSEEFSRAVSNCVFVDDSLVSLGNHKPEKPLY